jgi:DNA-binding transcriptional regulator YiaG
VCQSLTDRNEDVVTEAARSKLEMAPGRAVETVEGGLGLSGGELAGALGASARTVERWRTGQTYPQHEARERLAELWRPSTTFA